MVMLTRGVCRAIPLLFGSALAEVTTPLAITKIASPLAMRLPPYIVFCTLNVNVLARGSRTSALIANIMLFVSHRPSLGTGLTIRHQPPDAAFGGGSAACGVQVSRWRGRGESATVRL